MGDNALLKDYIPHELGIRGGLGGGGELPDFYAPLKTSLILSRGSGLPTYTRATSATFTDFEGLVKTVPAGCARFGGARFVRNLSTYSDDITKLGGAAGTSPPAITTASFGGRTCEAITFPIGGNGYSFSRRSGAGDIQGYYVFPRTFATTDLITWSLKIGLSRALTGSEQIIIYQTGDVGLNGDITLTSANSIATSLGLVRMASAASSPSGAGGSVNGVYAYLGGTLSSPVTLYVAEFQTEDVTGQANQNPSEYVSVGVLSYPYHGAGADGCKFFPTQNGNTVASNVVTEAAGAVIPAATLRKYFHEGEARTNLCLQSEAFDDAAWTKRGTCTVTPNALVSPDGKMTMDLIENLQLPVVGDIYQNWGVASGVRYEPSVYMQRVSTSGTLYLDNSSDSGFGRWAIDLSLLGSGTTRITRHHPAVTIIIEFTGTGVGDGGIQLRSSDAVSKSVYLFGLQGEVGTSSSAYIPTTTAAVTRNGDVLTYPVAGNMRDLAGACYAEYLSNDFTTAQRIVSDGAGGGPTTLFLGNSTFSGSWDGSTQTDGPTISPVGIDIVRKAATRWNASVKRVFEANLAGTEGAYDGSWSYTSIGIGGPQTPLKSGYIGEVKMWLNPPSDAKLQAMTA